MTRLTPFPASRKLGARAMSGTMSPEDRNGMPRRLPKYCVEDIDRHGNIRVYYRRGTVKVRLREKPWTDAFMAEYRAAIEGPQSADDGRPQLKRSSPGSIRWLCEQYFSRADGYLFLAEKTRLTYRLILEGIYDEPINVENPTGPVFADMPANRLTAKSVKVLRNRKIETKTAANTRIKVLRSVYRFGVEDELVTANPADDVPYIKVVTSGHHTWSVDEVRQYEARHPIGSKARLAMALLLYTGGRRSDAILLGRQHVRRGWFQFTAFKNRNRTPVEVDIPVLPVLQDVIDGSSTGNLTFLITKHDRPYTAGGFSMRFRKWCNEAGLHHCSAHGLRKAGATVAAENGATEHQLMAIFAWTDQKMAGLYTKRARRKKLAGDAMGLIDMGRTEYREVPLSAELPSSGTKTAQKRI
jgi:integrase